MQTAESDQRAEERLVAALKQRLGDRLLALVLFGSRARGTARPDSDWDVLAVASDLPDDPVQCARLLAEGPRTGIGSVPVVLRSPAEFTDRLQSLYLDIALDGQVLYDPLGIAARRLEELRALIRSEGLCREETSAGDVWKWRQPRAWGAWSKSVELTDDAHYRLHLATTHLAQAQQLLDIGIWVACVNYAQMAAENAAKAVLGLLGPVAATHDPGLLIQQALGESRFPAALVGRAQRLAECARLLGPEVHKYVAYGDEQARRTPWDLFDEDRARELLSLAEEAVGLARELTATS